MQRTTRQPSNLVTLSIQPACDTVVQANNLVSVPLDGAQERDVNQLHMGTFPFHAKHP